MATLSLAIALATGTAFVVSGVAKLRAGTFPVDLANYRLLPISWVLPVAAALPQLEIIAGVLILVYPRPALPLTLAAVLLATFTAGMVANLLQGRRIPCGCRSTGRAISWPLSAVNICWLVAAAVAAREAPSPIFVLVGASSNVSAEQGASVVVSLSSVALIWRLVASFHSARSMLVRIERLVGANHA